MATAVSSPPLRFPWLAVVEASFKDRAIAEKANALYQQVKELQKKLPFSLQSISNFFGSKSKNAIKPLLSSPQEVTQIQANIDTCTRAPTIEKMGEILIREPRFMLKQLSPSLPHVSTTPDNTIYDLKQISEALKEFGLSAYSTETELTNAYRKFQLKNHPDKIDKDATQEKRGHSTNFSQAKNECYHNILLPFWKYYPTPAERYSELKSTYLKP